MNMKRAALFLLALAATQAWAGSSEVADPAQAKWKKECGSCHVAYPPQLLAADNWKQLMGNLNRHFGANATLEARENKDILAYLLRNAGSGERYSATTLRISDTPWFKHEHHVISAKEWAHADVHSRSNCSACHGPVVLGD